MSIVDATLTLADRDRGSQSPLPVDDLLARRLELMVKLLEPDPLYRRRLRGEVVNRHVATREGLIARPPARRSQMGRVGRAVLYASLATAMTVSAAGAAAQEALPGDPLYGVKLGLEELRMTVAPPSIRPGLAAIVLEERLGEIEQAAAGGRWDAVEAAAQGVTEAVERLTAFGVAPDAAEELKLDRHATKLEELLVAAPPSSRSAIAHALAASNASRGDHGQPSSPGNQASDAPGGSNAGAGGNGSSNAGGEGGDSTSGHSSQANPEQSPHKPPRTDK